MSTPHKFLSDDETIKFLMAATSGFAAMFANIDILLKLLIGIATLMYLCLKISREIIERKERKALKDGQDNTGKN